MLPDVLENRNVIQDLANKAEAIKRRYQPKEEDFVGESGYHEREIRAELELVRNLKAKWLREETPESKHQKNVADVVEHIVVEQFSGEWLGNRAIGHYTAETDDLLRGIDVVAEFPEGEHTEYLGFAIDVTLAENPIGLDGKMARMWDEDIKRGKRSEVHYLETDNGFKGSQKVFRMVVGVSKEFARSLIRLQRTGTDKDALAAHPFQVNVLMQVRYQLKSYLEFAKITKNKALLVDIQKSLDLFDEVYEAKKDLIAKHQAKVEREPDYGRIVNFCDTELASARKFFSNES